MTVYALEVTDRARDGINALATKERAMVLGAIRIIQAVPRRDGTRLTDELAGYRRLKKGRYRVFYQVDEVRRVVSILFVGFRKAGDRHDAYREFQRLIGR